MLFTSSNAARLTFIYLNIHVCQWSVCLYDFHCHGASRRVEKAMWGSVLQLLQKSPGNPSILSCMCAWCLCVCVLVCACVWPWSGFGVRLPMFYPQFSLALRSHLGRPNKEDVLGFAEDVVAHHEPNHRTTTIVVSTSGKPERIERDRAGWKKVSEPLTQHLVHTTTIDKHQVILHRKERKRAQKPTISTSSNDYH